MRTRITFGAGFAVGYLLGARAGRERYESIMRAARRFADSPAVQETAGVLQAQAGELVSTAKARVGERLHVGSRASSATPYPTAAAGSNGVLP